MNHECPVTAGDVGTTVLRIERRKLLPGWHWPLVAASKAPGASQLDGLGKIAVQKTQNTPDQDTTDSRHDFTYH